MMRLYLAVLFSTTRFLLSSFCFIHIGKVNKKQACLGIPVLIYWILKRNALPNLTSRTYILPMLVSPRFLVSHVAGWFSVKNACFGREKEASELAPEASAELIRFFYLITHTFWEWEVISVPFARENLHLVVSFYETQPLYLHIFSCNPN